MAPDPTPLATELKALRKGRGIQAPQVGDQVGPGLRALCDITDGDGHAVIRDKVSTILRGLIAPLPKDLGIVLTAIFAVEVDTGGETLQDRIAFIEPQFDRGTRTIRRRMDEGVALLAEKAALLPAKARPPDAENWSVERVEIVLRLDTATPECLERRWVVAEEDGVERIRVSMTMPRPPDDGPVPDPFVEPYYGAVLTSTTRASGGRFVFDLDLPTPLKTGERHELALLIKLAADASMRPHLVLFPEREIGSFDLRVRFDPANVPPRVRSVEETFHRAIDEDDDTGRVLRPDRAHEVRVSFAGPRPGFGYGVRWD